ncbi:MAG TPA: hypothetical protein VIZ90_09035 [Rhizobiaceae bacterium]
MTYQDDTTGVCSGSLRAASPAARPASRLAAGPFEAAVTRDENGSTLPDALITGMLILYPVAATVVAAIVGVSLAGPVA